MTTSRNTLDLWRMDDHYDLYSTTTLHMFALCDVLTLNGECVPSELGYNPSPVLSEASVSESWPDSEYLERMDSGMLSAGEARRALILLHRYYRMFNLGDPE